MTEQFRTEVPNIIDDLGLDPFERVLYLHYKRVCGAYGGVCFEAVRTTSRKTKMAMGMVTKARESLQARGLITTLARKHKNDTPNIMIVDIWDLNQAYYSEIVRPNVDGWTVEQLRQWGDSVHTVNAIDHNPPKRSPNEYSHNERSLHEHTNDELSSSEHQPPEIPLSVHTVNDSEHNKDERSPGETKKVSSSLESNLIKESLKVLSPPQKLFLALADLCHIELRAASEKQKGQLGKASKALVNLVTDLDQFKAKFPVYWAAMDWRGQKGQSPDPPQIQESYGDYCHWVQNGAPTQARKGQPTNGTYQSNSRKGIKALDQTGESLASERTIDIYTREYVYPDGRRESIDTS